jgi:hypothetical protein
MGLESHITNVLAREKSGYVVGHDFWFEFGMTVESEDVARDIAHILNDSGEFGQATVKRDSQPRRWCVDFGVHKSFLKER